MSFAVPNRDFKVVFYDKYTGVSITNIITVLGYRYFFTKASTEHEEGIIISFLKENPTYIVTAFQKEYSWFPSRAVDSLYALNKPESFKTIDVLPDHVHAFQIVLDLMQKKVETKAGSNDLVTVYQESDFVIYHARTFKAFQTVATRSWIPDGESGWEYAMNYNSKRIFVLHIGDQTTTGKKFAIVGSPTNIYSVYDESGVVMPGSNFHLPVKNALDAFSDKLQLTA